MTYTKTKCTKYTDRLKKRITGIKIFFVKLLKYSNVWLNIFVICTVRNKLQVSLENYQIN